jgi:hypothetical protein
MERSEQRLSCEELPLLLLASLKDMFQAQIGAGY